MSQLQKVTTTRDASDLVFEIGQAASRFALSRARQLAQERTDSYDSIEVTTEDVLASLDDSFIDALRAEAGQFSDARISAA